MDTLDGRIFDGTRVMKRNAIVQTENDILSFDIPDDALERAAAVADGRQRITVGVCTDWFTCQWPLSPPQRGAAPTQT
jgi:hypothetical protein